MTHSLIMAAPAVRAVPAYEHRWMAWFKEVPVDTIRPQPAGSYISGRDCPCNAETPDPCPMCGATVSGTDAVQGVCQIMSFIGRPIGDWITRKAP